MNATTTKTTTNGAAAQTATAAAQACCNGVNDAFKAGVEANQNMFTAFTNAFTKGWTPEAFAAPAVTIPAAFEKMTKAMNSLVDSGARFATECNALAIDTLRTNARTIERTGDMMVGQLTGKTTKPAAETAREIFDEACGFTTKAGERAMKMNTEHAQRVSQVIDGAFACKTTCNG